jgi:hypothetical protein
MSCALCSLFVMFFFIASVSCEILKGTFAVMIGSTYYERAFYLVCFFGSVCSVTDSNGLLLNMELMVGSLARST